MYEFASRVRYSEIDEQMRMSLTSLVARMQDCCVFHSEAIGRGPEVWFQEKRGWVIVSWQVVIHRMPGFAEKVTTRTWTYGFRACEGDRNFTVTGADGDLCAEANSRWIYYDQKAQRPIRVPEEEKEGYGTEAPLASMIFSPRKIALPRTEPRLMEPFAVVETNLDTNRHVNNLQYIDMALPYLDPVQGKNVGELRVEYIHQCRLGDMLRAAVYETENERYISLNTLEGSSCAVVQFMLR